MSILKFLGSKRKARRAAAAQRKVDAQKRDLNRVYELARLLKSEEELNRLLESIPDDAVRAETKKLIEPFCLFKIKRVELATERSAADAIAAAAAPNFIIRKDPEPRELGSDEILPHEIDLRKHENLDSVDRERWSRAWAYAFVKSQTSEAVIACASRGFNEFLRIAKPVLAGHAFKYEDFQRMFAIIQAEATKKAGVRLN